LSPVFWCLPKPEPHTLNLKPRTSNRKPRRRQGETDKPVEARGSEARGLGFGVRSLGFWFPSRKRGQWCVCHAPSTSSSSLHRDEEPSGFSYSCTPNPQTSNPPPSTLHPTPYTLHPSPYTLHPIPRTLHPTPHNLHATPNVPHPTLSQYLLALSASPALWHLPRPSTLKQLTLYSFRSGWEPQTEVPLSLPLLDIRLMYHSRSVDAFQTVENDPFMESQLASSNQL